MLGRDIGLKGVHGFGLVVIIVEILSCGTKAIVHAGLKVFPVSASGVNGLLQQMSKWMDPVEGEW